MRIGLALVLVLVFLTASCTIITQPVKADSPSPQLQWSKTYPRPPARDDNINITHADGGDCFIQTSDGGYAIAGNIQDYFFRENYGSEENDSAVILKTDSEGNLQWQKTDTAWIYSQSIVQTKNLGYTVVSGSSLINLDAQGNIESNMTLDLSRIVDVLVIAGGYIVIGDKLR